MEMITKGINKYEELKERELSCKFGSQEYNELSLKTMMVSCFLYGSLERDSYNYNRYIKPRGEKLSNDLFEEVYTEQYNFLKTRCLIDHGVYTDFEGCTYNNLIYIGE